MIFLYIFSMLPLGLIRTPCFFQTLSYNMELLLLFFKELLRFFFLLFFVKLIQDSVINNSIIFWKNSLNTFFFIICIRKFFTKCILGFWKTYPKHFQEYLKFPKFSYWNSNRIIVKFQRKLSLDFFQKCDQEFYHMFFYVFISGVSAQSLTKLRGLIIYHRRHFGPVNHLQGLKIYCQTYPGFCHYLFEIFLPFQEISDIIQSGTLNNHV